MFDLEAGIKEEIKRWLLSKRVKLKEYLELVRKCLTYKADVQNIKLLSMQGNLVLTTELTE